MNEIQRLLLETLTIIDEKGEAIWLTNRERIRIRVIESISIIESKSEENETN